MFNQSFGKTNSNLRNNVSFWLFQLEKGTINWDSSSKNERNFTIESFVVDIIFRKNISFRVELRKALKISINNMSNNNILKMIWNNDILSGRINTALFLNFRLMFTLLTCADSHVSLRSYNHISWRLSQIVHIWD